MNKKLVGAIATGTIVIAGIAIGLGLKLKSTPVDQIAPSVSASSVVQTIDETETPATMDVNDLTPDEASQSTEGTGAAQQGEGESLEGEMENPPQGTPEAAEDTEQEGDQAPKAGDVIVWADGTTTVVENGDEIFGELTPEEIEYLRSMDLNFG